MEILKCLIGSMEKEICAADCYYSKSLAYKDIHSQLSSTYAEVASQELDHFMKFYTAANSYLTKKKAEGVDITAHQMLWEYEHEKLLDDYNELKYKIVKSGL